MTRQLDQKDYQTEWIAVRHLAVVWPEAQRAFHEQRAKKIAAEFDPDKLDDVRVTLPNGNGIYHVIDGQKRVRAIEMLWGPDEKCPCKVSGANNPAKSAELFLETNSKKNRQDVNAIDNFLVAITAERPDEVNIDKIVRHCGYHVDGSKSQNTIAAVEALRFGYRKGKQTLDRTLRVLRDTWSGDPAAVSSSLIKGYAAFICEFSGAKLDFQRLRDVVRKHNTSPGNMMADAKGIKDFNHINMTEAVVRLLLQLYNKGLKTPNKLKRKKD